MKLHHFGSALVAELEADGPLLTGESGALDIIGAIYGTGVDWVAIPAARLAPGFFELGTQEAGGFFQKLTNYTVKPAIVGDIAEHLAASRALRDFVHECNEGGRIRFVPSLGALEEALTGRRDRGLETSP